MQVHDRNSGCIDGSRTTLLSGSCIDNVMIGAPSLIPSHLQVTRVSSIDEGCMDRVNMYSSFYVAVKK